jgi:RteC protein
MHGIFNRVLDQLGAGLQSMEKETDLSRRYAGCLRLVKEAIGELKRALQENAFESKREEIAYFKEQLPVIYSRLFYFTKLYAIQNYRAYISKEKLRVILHQEIQQIETFHERHREVVQFTLKDDGFWDESLYTRQGYGDWWTAEETLYIDGDFTIGSYWVAKSRANADLLQWLTKQLEDLDREPAMETAGCDPKIGLVWTATQADLVELLYAIWLSKCVNHGKATQKEIMEAGAAFFGVELGNYHVTIIENASRKINSTKFLTRLVEVLKKKQDEML